MPHGEVDDLRQVRKNQWPELQRLPASPITFGMSTGSPHDSFGKCLTSAATVNYAN
jgi:hypothetical protein